MVHCRRYTCGGIQVPWAIVSAETMLRFLSANRWYSYWNFDEAAEVSAELCPRDWVPNEYVTPFFFACDSG